MALCTQAPTLHKLLTSMLHKNIPQIIEHLNQSNVGYHYSAFLFDCLSHNKDGMEVDPLMEFAISRSAIPQQDPLYDGQLQIQLERTLKGNTYHIP